NGHSVIEQELNRRNIGLRLPPLSRRNRLLVGPQSALRFPRLDFESFEDRSLLWDFEGGVAATAAVI
ncbi:MAG: hypothetical protein AAB225_29730, partial [Acidobacteriota bacterium]